MNIFTYLRLSALVLCRFLFTPTHAQEEEDYFITAWDLSLGIDNRNSISFYAVSTGDVGYTWETIPAGHSGVGNINNNSLIISNLPPKSKIKLKLTHEHLTRFFFIDRSSSIKLTNVLQWGKVDWRSMVGAFANCENLNITATDMPILTNVSSMAGMFFNCYKLNGPTNINWWNTQNITDMRGLFSHAKSFNQTIGNWNTQNVIDMGYMFSDASSFNQPIGKWDTKKVTDMKCMFQNASSFNQPIGKWDTKNVTDMACMFLWASKFNQRIDSLELNSLVNLHSMLDSCGLDCENYSKTLIGWANNIDIPLNRELQAKLLNYDPNAQISRAMLTSPVSQGGKGWIITDDTLSTEDCGPITAQEKVLEQSAISIYPNPAQDKLFLKNASAGSSYKIIDGGKEVNDGTSQNEEISISTLPAGLYTLLCENKYFTFVKE